MSRIDILVNLDRGALTRGLVAGFANGIGKNLGKKAVVKTGTHAVPGDKVATVVGVIFMVGGGVLAGVGQHILSDTIPNTLAKEEEDAQ